MNRFLDLLSATALASLITSALLLLVGWIWSIVAAFRSQRVRRTWLFLAFPLTYPMALVFLLAKDWRAATPGLICHALSLGILWGGGFVAERLEQRRIAAQTERLERGGESLAMASLIPPPAAPESNVWDHPFLKPLADAGQRGSHGDEAPNPHNLLEAPARNPRITYPWRDSRRREAPPVRPGLQELFDAALNRVANLDGTLTETNAPKSWNECAQGVVDHFAPVETEFAELRAALARPVDRFPYAWTEAASMRLPQLAQLKSFTRASALRGVAYAALGRNADVQRELETGWALLHTGDSDLLISRLVQMAQCSLFLNSVEAIQQFHALNDSQWAELDARLRAMDFPALVPASLRAERVFGHASMAPLLRLGPSGIARGLDRIGANDRPSAAESGAPAVLQAPIDLFLGGHLRAVLTRQWSECLTAYQEMIAGAEQTLVKSRTQPWKDCRPPVLERGVTGYGILAAMLLPALDKAYDKARSAQARIQLARVAVALERHYLAHGSYPETLDALDFERWQAPRRDPMDHQPWRYQRIAPGGFRLYTVGANGVDQHGRSESNGSGSAPHTDDVSWTIDPSPPPLPSYAYAVRGSARADGATGVQNAELLKRYGLKPAPPRPEPR